jgi:hypothetical protein
VYNPIPAFPKGEGEAENSIFSHPPLLRRGMRGGKIIMFENNLT